MNRGTLVVLEGIDGAGKSTLLGALAAHFRITGREVLETREPTDGPYGRKIRALAREGRRDELSPEQEFALFHEDRRAHVSEVVRPALERGALVLQDRGFFSTVAYQGERGLAADWILAESRAVAPDPDVLLVLDLPVDAALARIRSAGRATDDFETAARLSRIRQIFAAIPGAVILDAAAPAPKVFEAACRAVEAHITTKAG